MKDIHFDFTVSAVDAENIFHALQSEICTMHENILDRMEELAEGSENPEYAKDGQIDWFKRRIKYIEDLKLKMSNTAV